MILAKILRNGFNHFMFVPCFIDNAFDFWSEQKYYIMALIVLCLYHVLLIMPLIFDLTKKTMHNASNCFSCIYYHGCFLCLYYILCTYILCSQCRLFIFWPKTIGLVWFVMNLVVLCLYHVLFVMLIRNVYSFLRRQKAILRSLKK